MILSKACTVPVYLSACVHTGSCQLVALHWKELDATPSMRPGDRCCGVCLLRAEASPLLCSTAATPASCSCKRSCGGSSRHTPTPLLSSGCISARFKVHGGWRMAEAVLRSTRPLRYHALRSQCHSRALCDKVADACSECIVVWFGW